LRVLFFASDSFALEPLERLLESSHSILAVVSRPDRPAGRGLRKAPTPVVERARESNLDIWQPENLTMQCFSGFLAGLDWDAGVVVAYGGLIPRWLLDTPPRGFINLHPSLLPRYRGAAPVERALMNGSSITGVTTMVMNERLDAGDILEHHEVPINEDDTAGTLKGTLAHAGAALLVATLDDIEAGNASPVPQEEDKATYASPIMAADSRVEWSAPAESIDRLVRAMTPGPGAYTWFRGKRVKLWAVHVTEVPPEDEPGTIMNLGKEGFIVNTGTTGLQVVTLQPEGKNRMTAAEFTRGQRLLPAERFTADVER
jgi:methionyl-tRNA formyltransferase